MTRRFQIHWSSLALCGVLAAAPVGAAATNMAPPFRSPRENALTHRMSPVALFRALLGMSPEERQRALVHKSAADREIILAKLQEYEALPRAVREARLCQTELHWELADLMRLAPVARSNRMAEISVLYRPMVSGLLQEWDAVPAPTQKALLENQGFIGLYLRMQGSPAAAQQEIIDKLPPARREHWAQDMNHWQALPEKQRAELCAQFQHFCSLTGPEQKQTVEALSENERREMEKALQAFGRLPGPMREQCINSFRRFATMAPEERTQFLKNAARWDAMTARERQLWRELVLTLPPMPPMPPDFPRSFPPMPPGMGDQPPPMPPLPPNVTTPVVVMQRDRDLR